MERLDWPSWKEAIESELRSLREAETWELVEKPQGKNIVGCKWVFRIKRKADRTIEKYKAHLVARGFTQVYGVDYTETYAPVARIESLRVILALAARENWPIKVFDFNSAFLNGKLDDFEEIYMEQPLGFEVLDEGGQQYVAKLKKALYGLKQGGRTWYETLKCTLEELGFTRADTDFGIFYLRTQTQLILLAVHIDDCTMTGNSQKLIDQYKTQLNKRFSLTELGPIGWLLGLEVKCDRDVRTISLSQRSYIDAILTHFNMQDAKPISIPMDPNMTYSKDQCPTDPREIAHMKNVPYREAIGSLMYAAIGTRPDISFAVSTLSQSLDNPGQIHWDAVKRIFRYLLGTKGWRLTYGGEQTNLIGYTDADGASQPHRRAISGYAFLIDGGAVSWSSRKQELVTLSTAEAEYVAATHAAKEAIWLRRFLAEIFKPLNGPTTLYCDNQSAVAIATNGNFHACTKHIDIQCRKNRRGIDLHFNALRWD